MRARRLARLAAAALVLAAAPLAGAATSSPAVSAQADADASAYEQTKHLTRSVVFDGQPVEVDSRDMTVRASRTTQLRGRERIKISWSGARPTGGRAASPFGELGLLQEYPVVILQCRGTDDASLPLDKQVRPETCWTSSRAQRTLLMEDSQAIWRHDARATEEQRAQKSGLVPVPTECQDVEFFSTHVTPFVGADGRVNPSCTAETMAPEAAVGAAFPPAEVAAYTDLEGNGSTMFEVRSRVENESLGCSDTVACTIVVIPIMGIDCVDDDTECNKAGEFEAGSSNFGNTGVDLTVSPQLWWSASNWGRRFSIPIEFGLPPDACDVLDKRAPTGFYGSELMAQASLQWSPAYCLDKKRFKFQHNKMPDEAGFVLAQGGGAAAAFVSSRHDTEGGDPMGYAPTAVTGFSVGYVIDRPDNAGEYVDLRLNARLLAKLLTQSYLGSDLGRGHPGMASNPLAINADPEFQRLNPGISANATEAGATLLSLSEASDVLQALTSYIANDKDAQAFIDGKADPWGMVVNPSYKSVSLPRDEWPLLDDYIPVTNDECLQQNQTPYFTQLAAPVTSLRKIAEAVLDAWPNVQTKCERSTIDSPWKVGRIDRQGVGSRLVLGIVSMGDARRFGLREASLQTTKGTYVGPTESAISKALRTAKPSKSGLDPVTMEMKDVVKADGYPGTMVVYTAARTANLPSEDAAKVSSFIEIATSEGQRRGFGNGELPDGYLPITKQGVTAPLHAQAQAVAAAVAAQTGTKPGGDAKPEPEPETDSPVPDGSEVPAPVSVPDAGGLVDVPVETPPSAPETEKDDVEEETGPVTMPPTQAVTSPIADRLLPSLVAVLLAGLLATFLTRLWTLARRRQ